MRASAEESFTSSLRSLGLTTCRSTACGGGGTASCATFAPFGAERVAGPRRLDLAERRPSRRLRPRRASSTSGRPSGRCRRPFRPRRRGVASSMPSSTRPASTRASDSLPAWLVWIVFITCSERLRRVRDAEPLARILDVRRLVAKRLQEPHDAVAVQRRADQHRHDLPGAKLGGEVGEDLVARRLDVLQQLLHQRVVVIGEPLQHGEARLVAARPSRRPRARSPRSSHARGRRRRGRARGR